MTTPTTGNPAAGWYTDPSDPSAQRWYDGSAWTTHVQPAPAPVPAPPAPVVPVAPQYGFQPEAPSRFGYQPDAQSRFGAQPEASSQFGYTAPAAQTGWIQPVSTHYLANPSGDLVDGKNTPARVALWVSILSVLGVPIAAIVGIVLAVVGMKRAKTLEASGWAPKGRTLARWALGLSIVGVAVSVLVVTSAVRDVLDDRGVGTGPGVSGYDSQAVETDIANGIAAQAGVTVTVQCPEQLVTGAETTFQCVAVDPQGVSTTVNVQRAGGGWSWSVG